MKINLVRIDDRLIHGQVATVWPKKQTHSESSFAVMK